MASSSSSTAVEVRKHDVFLSFCGKDSRYTFTGTLEGLLKQGSIKVFVDYELNRGEEISSSLMKAIEESRISVIIFSIHYASSRWCLEELVKIMECNETHKQFVIPVFFHIDPTHVRNRTGTFGDGFAELVKSFDKKKLKKLQMTEAQFKDKVEKWKKALTKAANISGRTSEEEPSYYKLAEKVVEDISRILEFLFPCYHNNKLVGVKPIIKQIESLLQSWSRLRNVHAVGIWGMRGIGKTTIAKNVFDKISNQFEGSYFARNIREESTRPYGLTLMKQELYTTIFKHPISLSLEKITKGRLGRTKVLIVFDDVTSLEQVENLIDDINCLGPGSRIIITTTNRQVLRNCGVDDFHIYEMRGLLKNDALQLFSWYAFQGYRPNIDYNDLSNRVVNYTGGVPLALKVLGCYLLGKSKHAWESALKRFERIPHEDIHKVLKISYDELNVDEQSIFLDIACFLKGENKDFVINFLDACDSEAEIALSVLTDKCLINTSEDNKILMHDLLQEIGWEIVRQESIRDVGKRSRLWYHEDIYKVLEENEISNAIEGICLEMSKQREIIYLQPYALATMDRLRFFKLHNAHYEENDINKVHVSRELRCASTKLRYLCWHGCPLKSLQPIFLPKYLVALDMPHSNVQQLWSSAQLHNLKHIDLSFSKRLRIQDLSLAPNLENLILEGCTSLCEIASSIYGLNYKLLILNLRHCKSLSSLPKGIRLKSLKKVIFSGCSNLKKFPQIYWNMKELYIDETAIVELSTSSIKKFSKQVIWNPKDFSMLERLPSNIWELESLEHLNFSGCSKLQGSLDKLGNLKALRVLKAARVPSRTIPSSILNLRCLEELDLTSCGIEVLPNNLGQLSILRSLLLGRNFFESIPTSIEKLSHLSYLDLCYCERLQILPALPLSLQNIDAHNCTALKASSSLPIFFARDTRQSISINFSNCFKLVQDAISETIIGFQSLEDLYITSRRRLIRKPHRPIWGRGCICFPGWEIPEWFFVQGIGSSITLEKQKFIRSSDSNSLLICVVVEFRNYHNEGQGLMVAFECLLTREDGIMEELHGTLRGWDFGNGPENVDLDHVFLGYDSAFNFPDVYRYEDDYYCEMTIRFYVENLISERLGCCNVKKCGVWHPYLRFSKGRETRVQEIENFYVGESSSRQNT